MEYYDLDSPVILEVVLEQPRARAAKKLFQLSAYKRRPTLSVSLIVLGEVLALVSKIKDPPLREKAYSTLHDLIFYTPLHFHTPQAKALTFLLNTLLELDSRLQSADTLIFASAALNDSSRFYTFDKDFLENQILKTNFTISVLEP